MADFRKISSRFGVLFAVALVLAGGGFFYFKPKPGLPGRGPLELGATEDLGSFRVNLADGRVLTTTLAVHSAQGTSVLEKAVNAPLGRPMPAVRDAANSVLSQQNPDEITSGEGRRALRRELARAMNFAAWNFRRGAGPGLEVDPTNREVDGELLDADLQDSIWDSMTGPILKVYFVDFEIID